MPLNIIRRQSGRYMNIIILLKPIQAFIGNRSPSNLKDLEIHIPLFLY